ncbi:MAG TPA: hypothetical protein VGN72_14200 [Tepidisphaeraceae bacterium]|jgi:uncharacterized membrane protein YjjP (DUF1212 family)|nr:hypothetical protein [Tepidisphaeraceae bacterium]
MPVPTITLLGEKFVVIPEAEYLRLKRSAKSGQAKRKRRIPSAEDLADIAEIKRIKADLTQKFIPWSEAKKRLRRL